MSKSECSMPPWSGLEGTVLAALCAALIVPELVFLGSDQGIWGFPDWRTHVYRHGAFWPGLLRDWQPLFAQQPWLMFASYGFLHAGLGHLLVNLITLVSLGRAILREMGLWRFLTVYGVALFGGAMAFAGFGPSHSPMVGASGALFGLAGAIVAWNAHDAWLAGESNGRVSRLIFVPTFALAVLNAVMYALLDGQMAWEAHLGGYVAGAMAALLVHRLPVTAPAR